MSMNKEEFQQAIKSIWNRATTDTEFRQLCLSNPVEALKQQTGQTLPDGFQLKFIEGSDTTVVEKSENSITFSLPKLTKDGELEDEQLEKVAGGWGFSFGFSW